MRAHPRHLAALLALVLAPATAAAQTTDRCSSLQGPRSYSATNLFAGDYTLQNVYAADGANEHALQKLARISIPRGLGGSGGAVGRDWHGNLIRRPSGGLFGWGEDTPTWRPVRVEWAPAVEHALIQDWDELRQAATQNWCLATDRGEGFYMRFGVALDRRYETDASWYEFGGFGPWVDFDDVADYTGVEVYGYLRDQDSGLPVQDYRVTSVARANAQAEQLYGDFVTQRSMAYTHYDGQLWGRIERTEHQPPPKETCFVFMCWSDEQEPVVTYRRSLVGSMEARLYTDPRVGVPGVEVGGSRITVLVEFEGEPVTIDPNEDGSWFNSPADRIREMDNAIRYICDSSSAAGCGPGARWAEARVECRATGTCTYQGKRLEAFGGEGLFSSDQEERTRQACEEAASRIDAGDLEVSGSLPNPPQAGTGEDCVSGGNPVFGRIGMEPDEDRIEAELDAPSVHSPTETTAEEKRRINTGERRVNEDQVVSMPAQLERTCRRNAARDSTRIANAPVVPGSPRPTPSGLALYHECMERARTSD